MQWAPPINTLTLFDITGEPAVEGQDLPECQICMERLYNPALFPSEITTCHHRFHRDCLRNQWCNNNAGNTLEACRCPNCEQIFNCNTQLQDLTPQVNARLQELQQPAVVEVEAQGVQVEQPAVVEAEGVEVEQQVQQIPANNLQTYTRQNYLIDRATRRFTDCITQILRDIPPPVLNPPQNQATNNQTNNRRMEYTRFFLTNFIQVIIEKYKYFQDYTVFLGEIRNILNNINGRLQDNEFIRGLTQNPNGIFRRYKNHRPNTFSKSSSWLLEYLAACYNDADPDANNVIYRPENGIDIIFTRFEVREFINELCLRFVWTMDGYDQAVDPNTGGSQPPIWVNTVPIRWSDNAPYINPDLQFFQRYFQCFLDFLTALLEVNYNQAFQQQGGKRYRKTKKIRKFVKRVRKSVKHGKK